MLLAGEYSLECSIASRWLRSGARRSTLSHSHSHSLMCMAWAHTGYGCSHPIGSRWLPLTSNSTTIHLEGPEEPQALHPKS